MAAITPTETGYGSGAYEGSTPNVPGVPTYVTNEQFRISSSNDVLVLTSSEGGPVSIDVPDGFYSGSDLAQALEDAMNADNTLTGTGTITFSVAYNTSTYKFTIDAGTGYTIAYTNSGSDAGTTFGLTADASASQTIVSDSPTEPNDTITFDFDENSNISSVEYAIYDNTQDAYIDSEGSTSVSEVWQTFENWNGGGQAGRVSVYGLSAYTAYTYKIKAKNILYESAFCSNSDDMYVNIYVDWGTATKILDREVPTGNTKIEIDGVTVDDEDYTIYCAGGYGAISLTFKLVNNYGDGVTPDSSVLIEFSEDATNYSTGTHFFTISSDNDVMAFTSDQGSANIDVPDGNYDTADDLATALETAMNANTTLTGTGTITFSVTFSSTTYKYTIDAGEGHTIALDYWNSDAGYTFGFNSNKTASQTITSDESRGSNPRSLLSAPTGVEQTIYWDSYTDSGKSEYDTIVYIRLTPNDATALVGDDGEPRISDAFSVNNLPEQSTLINLDGYTFDKDTTPEWTAVMKPLRGGTTAFFRLTISDYDGVVVATFDSSVNVSGWSYQQAGAGYTAVDIGGVSGQYIDGTNKVKFTVPAADALTSDNDRPYKIILEIGEIRDRG